MQKLVNDLQAIKSTARLPMPYFNMSPQHVSPSGMEMSYGGNQSKLSLIEEQGPHNKSLNDNASAARLEKSTLHSHVLGGINMQSALSKAYLDSIDVVQEKRAKRLANNLKMKQAQIIDNVPVGPPGLMINRNKYREVQ